MQSTYERMGGTYTLGADGMYYPDLAVYEEDEPHYGKYGRMRKAFLKEHHGGLYSSLLLTGKLKCTPLSRQIFFNFKLDFGGVIEAQSTPSLPSLGYPLSVDI